MCCGGLGELRGAARRTATQELASQLDALARANCTRVFSEQISSRIKVRPEFAAALALAREIKTAAPNQPVILTVHEMKRLARNAAELMTLSVTLQAAGIQLELLTGPLPGIFDPHGMGSILRRARRSRTTRPRLYPRENPRRPASRRLEGATTAADRRSSTRTCSPSGMAVVAASFILAWAAEAAQVDISGGLAIAILAVIAVLPEYFVDLYFAYTAGSDPTYVAYAAANMTGSNRLLLGLGWSSVVLVAPGRRQETQRQVRPRTHPGVRLPGRTRIPRHNLDRRVLHPDLRADPAAARIRPARGFFGFYLWKVSRGEVEEPHLVGPAATIGALPKRTRRILVVGLFVFAAMVILARAEPFAHALIGAGTQLGIDQFLLVQWLAPLASEAPEFIVAILFAVRGNGAAAIGTLISSKVNQWTLLIGSLPLAYLAGGGTTALHLDARQVEEFLLTATQTLLGVAALLALQFPRWAAWTLLALFALQFALPGQTARYVLCGIYAVIALAALIRNRSHIWPTLTAPFRTTPDDEQDPAKPVSHASAAY